MAFRLTVLERDLSGFVITRANETGAMVVNSHKGPVEPILCLDDSDVALNFGFPDATKWATFEAIQYARVAPLWVASAIGDNAEFGGVDVRTTAVTPFGTRTGRDWYTFGTYTTTSIDAVNEVISASADGLTYLFSGTAAHTPITGGSFILKVAGVEKDATELGGEITGDDIFESPYPDSTLNLTNGAYSILFDGIVGIEAYFISDINLTSNVDLSGAKPKAINLNIDGTLYENINITGVTPAATTKTEIINKINTAVGATRAASYQTHYIKITGTRGDAASGIVRLLPPTDTTTYDNGIGLAFNSAYVSGNVTGVASVSPTGAVPRYSQAVTMDYIYTANLSTLVSHSFFSASAYDDDKFPLAVKVEYLTGKQYKLTLYQVQTDLSTSFIAEYTYSLIREKDGFGKSLYIEDVFKDNRYLRFFVNTSYTGTANPTVETITLSGGDRGTEPAASDYLAAWTYFEQKNKFAAVNFMDIYGNSASTINNLITDHQTTAFGITPVPIGNNRADAITYRQGLGLDTDKIALYTNWQRIEDPFNNSSAWTSGIGKIGVKFASMEDVFDGLAPAGLDEDGHGGQISTGFKILEVEYDYKDTDLQLLDNAQINPVIFDTTYGPMVYGDRTLKATNSDTSYIGARRLYNLIIRNVTTQVLRQQEFKLNDVLHRLRAKVLTEAIINPIAALGLIREFIVQCDERNNNDDVLNQRKFILDVVIKITPTSEFITLRLTRVSQTAVLSEFLA